MNCMDDVIRLTREWSIERAPNALRIGLCEKSLLMEEQVEWRSSPL